jgi:hypothetical protein
MAADPFNSVGGYSIGIPPRTFVDSNGNLIVGYASVVNNLSIAGTTVADGSITAPIFIGNIQGNVLGSFQIPGPNYGIVFNNNGVANTDAKLTFDPNDSTVRMDGILATKVLTLGLGDQEFSTTRILNALTSSSAADQILFQIPASFISSIDYTVVATDMTANTRQTSKLIASVLGSDVGYYEYGTIDMNGGVGDFKVKNESGYIIFTVSPLTSNEVKYKIMITSIKEG